MLTGRPKKALALSAEEEAELRGFASSRRLPHALVARATLVLWSAEGKTNTEIAFQLQWTKATVGKWRQRFIERRLGGLYDELRPGRPRSVSDEKVALLLRRTLKNKPPAGSHWSVRQAADSNGLSKSTVHRVFRAFAVQPHRSKNFKLSSDPFFIEKVRDVVGLYLNPPDHAIVLSVDEKSQIQALDRTQPVLPMGLGYVEGVTHDYVRHGTTTLFAALDIASGTVLTECKARHRHQEFLAFLKRIDQAVPAGLEVHLIVDSYATHSMPRYDSGSHNGPASRSTTLLPTRPSSIKSNAGSASSPSRRFAEVVSEASNTSSPESTTSSSTTTVAADHSRGPQQQTPSFRSLHDFVHVSLGQHTNSAALERVSNSLATTYV